MGLFQSCSAQTIQERRYAEGMLHSTINQDFKQQELGLLQKGNIEVGVCSTSSSRPVDQYNEDGACSLSTLDDTKHLNSSVSGLNQEEVKQNKDRSVNDYSSHGGFHNEIIEGGVRRSNERNHVGDHDNFHNASKDTDFFPSSLNRFNHKRGVSVPGVLDSSPIQFELPSGQSNNLSIKSIRGPLIDELCNSRRNGISSDQLDVNMDGVIAELKQEALKIQQKLLTPITGNEAAKLVSTFLSRFNDPLQDPCEKDDQLTLDTQLIDPQLAPLEMGKSEDSNTNSSSTEISAGTVDENSGLQPAKRNGAMKNRIIIPNRKPYKVEKFKLQRSSKPKHENSEDFRHISGSDSLFYDALSDGIPTGTAENISTSNATSTSTSTPTLTSTRQSHTQATKESLHATPGNYYNSLETNVYAQAGTMAVSPALSFTGTFPQFPHNAFPNQYLPTGPTSLSSASPNGTSVASISSVAPQQPPQYGNYMPAPTSASAPAPPPTTQPSFPIQMGNWPSPLGTMSPLSSPNWAYLAESPNIGGGVARFAGTPPLPVPNYNLSIGLTPQMIPMMQNPEYLLPNSLSQLPGQDQYPHLRQIEQPVSKVGGSFIGGGTGNGIHGASWGRKRSGMGGMDTQCHQCGTTNTPEWRRGPQGLRTLCNACGLFHAKIARRHGEEVATRLLKQRKPVSR